jgi:hypothetical protein
MYWGAKIKLKMYSTQKLILAFSIPRSMVSFTTFCKAVSATSHTIQYSFGLISVLYVMLSYLAQGFRLVQCFWSELILVLLN